MSSKELVEAVRAGLVWAPPNTKFILASGAESDYYVDFDLVMMTPTGACQVIGAIARQLEMIQDYNAVGGPSSGADPIVGALMLWLAINYSTTQRRRGFKVRKEPKGRGPAAGSLIEGYLSEGDKAVIIEDVTTSGGSVLKAIKAAEDVGAKVVKVITILDRLAGAAAALKDYDFTALLTINELMAKDKAL